MSCIYLEYSEFLNLPVWANFYDLTDLSTYYQYYYYYL